MKMCDIVLILAILVELMIPSVRFLLVLLLLLIPRPLFFYLRVSKTRLLPFLPVSF